MFTSLLIFVGCSEALAFITSSLQFILVRFLVGVGYSGIAVNVFVFVSEFLSSRHRSTGINIGMAAFTISLFALTGLSYQERRWRWQEIYGGAPGILTLLFYLWVDCYFHQFLSFVMLLGVWFFECRILLNVVVIFLFCHPVTFSFRIWAYLIIWQIYLCHEWDRKIIWRALKVLITSEFDLNCYLLLEQTWNVLFTLFQPLLIYRNLNSQISLA